jgi:hypothetical protein
MLSKRGTKKLRDAGIQDIEVHKGLYGFYLYDPRLSYQTGTSCRDTADRAVEDALGGLRPVGLCRGCRAGLATEDIERDARNYNGQLVCGDCYVILCEDAAANEQAAQAQA